MAGVDFDHHANLKLELGYRYLNSARSRRRSICLAVTGGASHGDAGGVPIASSRAIACLERHPLGLLWTLGEPRAGAPIVTRY